MSTYEYTTIEFLTIGDEIISMISYLLRGIEFNGETLAVDVIAKVGPRGHYLSQPHTLKHFRDEHWFPTLLDRQTRDAWIKDGAKDLPQRARMKTTEILNTHHPPPLATDIERDLDRLAMETEKTILHNGK